MCTLQFIREGFFLATTSRQPNESQFIRMIEWSRKKYPYMHTRAVYTEKTKSFPTRLSARRASHLTLPPISRCTKLPTATCCASCLSASSLCFCRGTERSHALSSLSLYIYIYFVYIYRAFMYRYIHYNFRSSSSLSLSTLGLISQRAHHS